jgi:cytochrome P450
MMRLDARRICPIDLTAPEVVRDPYPAYRILHRDAPVSWSSLGFWLVARHAEGAALLEDPRLDHWGRSSGGRTGRSPLEDSLARGLRLLAPGSPSRRAVAEGLAAVPPGELTRRTGRRAESLRAGLDDRRFELMAEYAHPLTWALISELMGVPEGEARGLCDLAAEMQGGYLACLAPEALAEGLRGPAARFLEALRDLLREKRRRPGGDLVSRILAAAGGQDETDLLALLIVLFYAGHHNMMSFLGNAVAALAAHPEALAAVHRGALPRGIGELLRFDSPAQLLALTASVDLEIEGQQIAAGEGVFVALGAANRDPRAFQDPDRLDLGRRSRGHLSFGAGVHRCLGARVAEGIGAEALARLLGTDGVPVLEHPIAWRSRPFVQRGPEALRLEIRRLG